MVTLSNPSIRYAHSNTPNERACLILLFLQPKLGTFFLCVSFVSFLQFTSHRRILFYCVFLLLKLTIRIMSARPSSIVLLLDPCLRSGLHRPVLLIGISYAHALVLLSGRVIIINKQCRCR